MTPGFGASPPSAMKELPTMKAHLTIDEVDTPDSKPEPQQNTGNAPDSGPKPRLPQQLELAVDEPTRAESQKLQSGARASPTGGHGDGRAHQVRTHCRTRPHRACREHPTES